MFTPTIAVVILNYNGRHFLAQFLPSVLQYSAEAKVIVADNGSTDDSLAFLSLYPTVQVITLKKNHGFAGGYNKALRQVQADYYILLNSDVEVTPDWILPVIQLMEENEIAICQPKIKSFHQKSHFEYAGAAGGFIDRWGFTFCRGRLFDTLEEDRGQYDNDTPIFWASGACLFIKSSIFWDLGGFDEYFFAHMEEVDLCWRAHHQGYLVYCCGTSEVFHVGGGTLKKENPQKTFLNFRNNLIMLQKNTPKMKLLSIIFVRLLLDGMSGVRFLLKGQVGNFSAVLKAHFHFYKYLFLIKKKKRYNLKHLRNYSKSIVWAYFIEHRRTFKELDFPNGRSLTQMFTHTHNKS
ncbi:MAG: glycosyltransferase family 2 protein [Bacteroidota bacterium]